MSDLAVLVERVVVRLFRAEADQPMVTSFGSLRERPALILEVEDSDGARGWGEVWCNFPVDAAEHRALFVRDVVAPLLVGTRLGEPSEARRLIDGALGIQTIQAGEQGLLAAVSAGVDQALWDLVARRQGVPLWRLLNGSPRVRVYSSGLIATGAEEVLTRLRSEGHRAFKFRVGFDDRSDLQAVASAREILGPDAGLMVDANQAWTARHAVNVAERLVEYDVAWLEEPIRADEPMRVWREVAARSPLPLAGGENVREANGFSELIDGRIVRHIQPDIGKWGGISEGLAIGRRAVSAGLAYSPHWQGGGIGLALSMDVLAAVGGGGFAEIDSNPNPLRDLFPLPPVVDGAVELSEAPGFGFEPDFEALDRFRSTFG